jgi:hypothetical protein
VLIQCLLNDVEINVIGIVHGMLLTETCMNVTHMLLTIVHIYVIMHDSKLLFTSRYVYCMLSDV